MTVDWKIWAGLVIVVLGAVTWFYVGQVQAERDLAVNQAQTLARENDSLAAEVQANTRALASREAERARLAAEKQALTMQLERIYGNNPEARAWADSPCPDGVIECLR